MRGGRLMRLGIGLLAAAVLACLLYQCGPHTPWWPRCLLHRWTGFDCPGCGMTRALHAALHGRWGAALRFNPLGMLVLPVVLAGLGLELAGWLRGRPLPVRFTLGARGALWILAGVLGYWILRNLPLWPFPLPAPP